LVTATVKDRQGKGGPVILISTKAIFWFSGMPTCFPVLYQCQNLCVCVCRIYYIFTVVHYHPVFTSIKKILFFLVVPAPKFGLLSVLPGG